jgi:hypothetical protein
MEIKIRTKFQTGYVKRRHHFGDLRVVGAIILNGSQGIGMCLVKWIHVVHDEEQ